MALPFFYISDAPDEGFVQMPEDSSKHIVQVLRMQEAEQINLTDGKGKSILAEITEAHRKRCVLKILNAKILPAPARVNKIAISPLKNTSRFEWFLEKATELGINEIIPLICERTEKQSIKKERLQNILVSAMLQSQQYHLPVLHEPTSFSQWIQADTTTHKWIAHCEGDQPRTALSTKITEASSDAILLIGPEGDFSPSEIASALSHQFLPVSLGTTRLRSETAGIAAAVLMTQGASS